MEAACTTWVAPAARRAAPARQQNAAPGAGGPLPPAVEGRVAGSEPAEAEAVRVIGLDGLNGK